MPVAMAVSLRPADCVRGRGEQEATYGVGWVNERVVDGDDVDVIVLDGVTEDNATDATEAVDSNLGLSHFATRLDVS